jgi:hypothetical protein
VSTYLRGALIEFMPTILIPLPNIIIFQYNPETMTHTWSQPEAAGSGTGDTKGDPLAVKGSPGEQFSFTIAMDANDTIAEGHPVVSQLAEASGVYTRLAALEMLMYPLSSGTSPLLGAASVSLGGKPSGVKRSVPAFKMPTVLFVWGPGRIVPVRLTGLTITERLYDGLLSPTHAEAQLGLRVLTPEELKVDTDILGTLANGAYVYTNTLRQALALLNLANAVDGVVGMLPL